MTKYAVFFSKRYVMSVEANDTAHAIEVALEEFIEDEADAASSWEIDDYIDKLED